MDGWLAGVCFRGRGQDESFAGVAGCGDCASTGAGVAEGYSASCAHAAAAGAYDCDLTPWEADQVLLGRSCVTFPADERTGILVTLI